MQMTTRLNEEELENIATELGCLIPVQGAHMPSCHEFSSRLCDCTVLSMLSEIRASRKAASVVKETLDQIMVLNEGFEEDFCNRVPEITAQTLANPNVQTWLGGDV